MEVILLERIEKLGQMGDKVVVKSGFARNYLLPQGKALRATQDNIAYFGAQKKYLEAENDKRRTEAEKLVKKLEGTTVAMIRQASDGGQLYGSVSSRDIAESTKATTGVTLDRNMVRLNHSFKMLGLYTVQIKLHPEVAVDIVINIARSAEEAKAQEQKGSAVVDTDEASLKDTAIAAAEAEEEKVKAKAEKEAADAEKEAEKEAEKASAENAA